MSPSVKAVTAPTFLESITDNDSFCSCIFWNARGNLITGGGKHINFFDGNLKKINAGEFGSTVVSVAEQGNRCVVVMDTGGAGSYSLCAGNCEFFLCSQDLKTKKNFASVSPQNEKLPKKSLVQEVVSKRHHQVIVHPSSVIIASNSQTDSLKIYTENGDFLYDIKLATHGAKYLHALPDGSLIISYEDGHVRKYRLQSKKAVLVWSCNIPNGIAGISSDSAGFIYVAGPRSIYVLSAQGTAFFYTAQCLSGFYSMKSNFVFIYCCDFLVKVAGS